MKKDIKKIDKKKLKDHIKKYALLTLNIFCYICTLIFVISLIVGACTPPKQSAKMEKPVSTMILRDRAPLNRLPFTADYFYDIDSITLPSTRSSLVLSADYDSNYIYKNPTYLETYSYLNSYIFNNEGYYVELTTPYVYNNTSFKYVGLYRFSNISWALSIYTEGYRYDFAFFQSWNTYISINNPVVYSSIFSGSYSFYYGGSSVTEPNQYLQRYFLYYYSSRSVRNFTLYLYDNPIKTIQESMSEYDINNGVFFYNSDLLDLYEDTQTWELDTQIIINSGGFSNPLIGSYFDNLRISVCSAYTGRHKEKYYLSEDNIVYGDNASLKGYFFISGLYYGDTFVFGYDMSITNDSSTGMHNAYYFYEGSYHRGAYWVNENYRYLSLYYISYFKVGGYYPNASTPTYAQYMPTYSSVYQYAPTGYTYTPIENTSIFNSVFKWLSTGFLGIMPILSFQLLPNLTLGVVLLIPFFITLILFIVRLFKR